MFLLELIRDVVFSLTALIEYINNGTKLVVSHKFIREVLDYVDCLTVAFFILLFYEREDENSPFSKATPN